MEWTPSKTLFLKDNDSFAKLMGSVTSGLSLWCRPYYQKMLNYVYDTNVDCLWL